MADLTQQYLDILRGYGVDTSQLQYADPAKLKRIVDQTRQAPDTGGGAMAVGQQAAQQAAKDVIGGTTPRKGLEDLLKEAHTGPDLPAPGPSMASETLLPTDQPPLQSVEDVEKRMYRPRQSRVQPAPAPEMQPGIYDPLTEGPAYEPTEDLVRKAMTGPSITPGPSMASETLLPTSPAPKMANVDEAPPYALSEMDPDKIKARQSALGETLRPSRTPMQITGKVQEDTAAMPMVDVPEDSEVPKEGLLSRLGNAAKANPDIALAGMEGIGSLLANIGAGRAQKAADQTQREGMARSNLVSALTGGKVRPGVAEEAPQMGLLGRVGQAVGTAGRLGREVSQERFERGFKEEEMGRKYDVKEAELDRKIADDARKLAELARKEKLDEARIENWIAKNTLGMDRNAVARYRAEIYAKLGEGRLELDVAKFEQGQKEFNELLKFRERGMTIDEAMLDLKESEQDHAFEYALKEFGLDERRVAALEKNAATAVNRANAYAEQVAIAAMAARGEQKREVRKMVDGLDGKQLNRMMDPKQGTAAIMQGLQAAYKDFEVDPNTANMNAVFQMYQRLFDPATVREGDLAIQKEGQGALLNIMAQVERIQGGGFVLAKETIENMKGVADRYYATALNSANNKLDSYINTMVLGPDDGSRMPEDIRQAEALRNYYNAVWTFDPTQTQVRTGEGATRNVNQAADDFVNSEFSEND